MLSKQKFDKSILLRYNENIMWRETQNYTILRAGTSGERVSTSFAPLEAADATEIGGVDWQGVYAAVWQRILEEESLRRCTLKLVCDGEEDRRIQGLLYLGERGSPLWSLECLLEAAPWNRYGLPSERRQYQGVGKVLVARVVAEHLALGYRDPLLIDVAPRAVRFYERLGWVQPRQSARPNRYMLEIAKAEALLQSVLCVEEGK